jgi:hypothetical protein
VGRYQLSADKESNGGGNLSIELFILAASQAFVRFLQPVQETINPKSITSMDLPGEYHTPGKG